jgi:hypothetical protein
LQEFVYFEIKRKMTAEEQDRCHLEHNAHLRTHLTNLNVPLQRILIPLLLLQPFLIYAKKSLIKSGPHEFSKNLETTSKFWAPEG